MADSNQLNIALYESVTSNCELTCFEPVSTSHVRDLICSSKIKCCALDPLSAPLMTKCLRSYFSACYYQDCKPFPFDCFGT